MSTIAEAQMKLTEIVLARRAAGLRHDRIECEPVLCEGGTQIIAYIDFIGSDDDGSIYVSFDLPVPILQRDFDAGAFAQALLSGSRTVH
jgi:hypothetical protein